MEIDFPIKIRFRFFGYFLFSTVIFFLARSYIGGFFVFIFYLFLFAPIISILHLIIALSFVRYYQLFENEHPVKGEDVKYRLILADESILPIPRMRIHFKRIHPYLETITEDITLFLSGEQRIEKDYTIRCPYRGIYTIGLERIAYEDFLGILEISRKIWYRTFYVYPRILQLESMPHTFRHSIAERQSMTSDIIEDTTLFAELRDYRRNESLRHVYWKKFASTGRPYIKEYSISTEPAVSIFLDMRKGQLSGIDALIAEDVSVEIMIALVNHFIKEGIRLKLFIYGNENLAIENQSDFNMLYRKTITMIFKEYSYFNYFDIGFSGTIIITHILDSLLTDITEHSRHGKASPLILFNLAGAEKMEETEHQIRRMTDRGARIIIIHDSNTIPEELAGNV